MTGRWIGLLLILSLAGPAMAAPAKTLVPPLAIAQIPLSRKDPALDQIGPLRYMGGLYLRSSEKAFGGLSGLDLGPKGKEILAVSDDGHWLVARLIEDKDGRLTGLADPVLGEMRRPDGEVLAGRAVSDSEAVSLDPKHHAAYVTFEGRHRLWRFPYDPKQGPRSLLQAVPEEVEVGGVLANQPNNGGVEALLYHPKFGVIGLSEQQAAPLGKRMAWLLAPKSPKQPPLAFAYDAPLPYEPTDMALLPDGDLLILNRKFAWTSGVATNIVRAKLKKPRADTVIRGEVIAKFADPLASDNFEGLAIRRDHQGRTWVYMVSDDNFNPAQRTLLLKFELIEP